VIAGEALGPGYAAEFFTSYQQGMQPDSNQQLTPDRQQVSQHFPLPPTFNTKAPQSLNTMIERDPSWGRGPDGRDLDRSLDLQPSF
jgi:hypothetical protein